MTVERIFWPGIAGRDLHLLPGLVSPRLDRRLRLEAGERVVAGDAPPPGVTVEFAIQLAPPLSDLGIIFSPDTGEIAITKPLPAETPETPRVRSFVVTATVTDPAAATPFTTTIRVHVHEELTGLRLTPASLTVREGAAATRFTVLAAFGDGTTGDISNWSPPTPDDQTHVHAAGSTEPELLWSAPDGASVAADPTTGVLRVTVGVQADPDAPDDPDPALAATVAVTVRSSAGLRAEARAQAAPSWSVPRQAFLLAGPGLDAVDDAGVHNVLFMPDGFTAGEQASFDRFVRVVIGRLSARRRTRPWDLVTGRINWFSAFVPSPEAGISLLGEIDRIPPERGEPIEPPPTGEPPIQAVPILPPVQPGDDAEQWTLAQLLYMLGPPTPLHDPLDKPLEEQVGAWSVLYGVPEDALTDLVGPAYSNWLELGDRVLVNERDTAFHTASGVRPALGLGADPLKLSFNPLRTQAADLEAFLGALTDEGRTRTIGGTWTKGRKDDDLVVLVSRINLARSGFDNLRTDSPDDGRYLCVGLGEEMTYKLRAAGPQAGFDVEVRDVPDRIVADVWMIVAHELGHSLDLGDEYGRRPGPVDPLTARGTLRWGNTQQREPLLGDDGRLDPGRIKWGGWPRIAKAGVLAAAPAGADGGDLTLTLEPGHARAFRDGDVVRLRTRPLTSAAGHSEQLAVAGDPAGDMLRLHPLGGTVAGAGYPAGSIVMAPVREDGGELMLMAAVTSDWIKASSNPLNVSDPKLDQPNQPCAGEFLPTPTPAALFPEDERPVPPRFSSQLVGIYESAATYACGIYRPTGVCIMRSELTYQQEGGGRIRVAEFCPVCRYVLVDLLDPTQHGRIDRDYARVYPAEVPQ